MVNDGEGASDGSLRSAESHPRRRHGCDSRSKIAADASWLLLLQRLQHQAFDLPAGDPLVTHFGSARHPAARLQVEKRPYRRNATIMITMAAVIL